MSKPWSVKPFNKLRAVQVYEGAPACENIPTCGNRAKIMFQAEDGHALDLCFSCAEEAYADGAFKDRFALDNHSALMHRPKGVKYTDPWLANSSSWHKLPAEHCKDGRTYQERRVGQ